MLLLNSYLQEKDFTVDHLSFDFLGGRYEGRASLKWQPHNGYHLEAFIKRHGSPLPKQVALGSIRLIQREDMVSMRLKSRLFALAIAPNVILTDGDCMNLIIDERLKKQLSRLLIWRYPPYKGDQKAWSGAALYATGGDLYLPDTYRYEKYVEDNRIQEGFERTGIEYEDEYSRIIGFQPDQEHLEIKWTLSDKYWEKLHSWRWPLAFQDALSILLGRTIKMVLQEARFGGRERQEIRMEPKVERLGLLAPFMGQDNLDKQILFQLTEALTKNMIISRICNHIFSQITEASIQRSWQARELLLSTILEATLRTVYLKPFKAGGEWLDVKEYLEKFRKEFLSDIWKEPCAKAVEAHRELRHRNAHPDWLVGNGGYLSKGERENALDMMMFLARFYGYMILSLAGIKDLQPMFPKTHKDWGPIMTIEHG